MKIAFGILCTLFSLSAYASSNGFASTRTMQCLPLDQGLNRGCGFLPNSVDQCDESTAPFFMESCLVENSTDELVPELIQVSGAHAPIVSPLVFKSNDEDKVIRSLLYRIYVQKDLPEIKKLLSETPRSDWHKLWSLYDALTIQIEFKADVSASIGGRGFLNLYQIHQSNGYNDPPARLKSESAYLDLNLADAYAAGEKHLFDVLPKYAYASPVSFKHSITPSHRFTSLYGNVFAQLKPEILHRASFTPNDSLISTEQNLANGLHYTARRIFKTAKDLSNRDWMYSEAQVFGKLDRKAIDFLLVNCFEGEGWDSRREDDYSITDLQQGTIELVGHNLHASAYQCNPVQMGDTAEAPAQRLSRIEMKDDQPVTGKMFRLEKGRSLYQQ